MADEEERTTRQRPTTKTTSGGGFRVVVASGARPSEQVIVHSALPSRVYVGKSDVCDLRLADERVSRRHLALELVNGVLRVTDLGSTNGTLVNGVSLIEGNLFGGEQIVIGDTTLRVERADQGSSRLTPASSFGRMLGCSDEMKRIYPLCERLAESDLAVLIEGETGTGKEILAEAIHENSPRAQKPFVVLDCTTVAANLLESVLFGHERGSFTGAVDSHRGVFEQAHGGSLLVDELGELPLALQAKLLRAIERHEVQRVGGTGWIKCDVRVLAATRRDLEQEIAAGNFRDDLFYRLAVARVELPPLRKRTGDIAHLTRHFWKRFGGQGEAPVELVQRFESYHWPGNVRELVNALSAHIALGDLARIEALASRADQPSGDLVEEVLALDLPLPAARQKLIDEFERRYIERVLAKNDGSVVRSAAASGIARRYFQILKARGKT